MSEITWDTPLEETAFRKRGKLEICRCGHAASRHIVMAVGTLCDGGRRTCPCGSWMPVLKADDARDFMYGWKTSEGDEGESPHPLLLGIRRGAGAGHGVEWLTPDGGAPECDAPECSGVSVGARFIEQGFTVLVCSEHLIPKGARNGS
jgi:hypothetical protein